MPTWFGDALGSAIGLVAILLGALYNARLTRERDDKIMSDEAKSVAMAIGTEMAVYAEMLCGRLMQASTGGDGMTAGIIVSLRAPQPVVWPSLAEKVGDLDAEVCAKAVKAWMLLQWHAQLLDACIADIQAGQWSEAAMRSRCEAVKRDLPIVAEAVEGLTGKRPALEYALP